MGYPLFMKPFDGGGWRGVSRIKDEAALMQAYDDSGEMLMHLQKSVEPYDVFARALTIGPETMVMHFRPDEPMHDRYAVDHDFLSPGAGQEATTIAQTVNAFFRWEFNSCEMLVQGDTVLPIDYANACPDVAVTSLHYYFPWAMKRPGQVDRLLRRHRPAGQAARRSDALVRGRRRPGRSTTGPSSRHYQRLADEHFDKERYLEFCAEALPDLDELVLEWVASADFDQMLDEDDHRHLPRARAGPVPRPLPRPDRPVDQ